MNDYGLPTLSSLDTLTALNFTFIFDLTTTFGTTDFIQALVILLLSVLPGQPQDPPSVRLALTFFDNHLEDDETRRNFLIIRLVESIEWWRLEVVVEALGWNCQYPTRGPRRVSTNDVQVLTIILQHSPLLRGMTHPFEDDLRERVTEIIRRRLATRLRGGVRII